ncbi:MAG: DUF488 domain-containing protein [Candidatus Dormibacteria bacterium]
MAEVGVARIYEPRAPGEGERILVDRLWPRGVARESPLFDRWLKQVAPSSQLRRWYGHLPARRPEFAVRYRGELGSGAASEELSRLVELARDSQLTLVTATRALHLSAAVILAEVLAERLRRPAVAASR